MKKKNSFFTVKSSRKHPFKQDVIIDPFFLMPRISWHKCLPFTTTPMPFGCRISSKSFATRPPQGIPMQRVGVDDRLKKNDGLKRNDVLQGNVQASLHQRGHLALC